MKWSAQGIVKDAIARHLGLETCIIGDADRLDRDLDLDAFDIALLGLRFEATEPDRSEFPVELVDASMRVRELVAVYVAWAAPVDEDVPDTVRTTVPTFSDVA